MNKQRIEMFTAEQMMNPVDSINRIRQHHNPGCEMLKGILTKEEAQTRFEQTRKFWVKLNQE
jgi:hypothetical protein